jgi:hypothetical protein
MIGAASVRKSRYGVVLSERASPSDACAGGTTPLLTRHIMGVVAVLSHTLLPLCILHYTHRYDNIHIISTKNNKNKNKNEYE